MHRLTNLFFSLVVVVIFLAYEGQALAAPFTNGDFSSGYTGWGGQLSDGPNSVAADLSSDSHFSFNSNIATISYLDPQDPYWMLSLYQSFDADPLLGAGNKLNMSFWMQLSLPDYSSIDNHIVSATLGSLNLVDTTDAITLSRLFSGYQFNVDVSSMAGTNVDLAFSLGDLDFSTPDYLRVGNISFSQVAPPGEPPAEPVPEPGTLLLVGAGLAGIVYVRCRKKISF